MNDKMGPSDVNAFRDYDSEETGGNNMEDINGEKDELGWGNAPVKEDPIVALDLPELLSQVDLLDLCEESREAGVAERNTEEELIKERDGMSRITDNKCVFCGFWKLKCKFFFDHGPLGKWSFSERWVVFREYIVF